MKQNARRLRRRQTRDAAKPLEKGIRIIEYLGERNNRWTGVREVAAAVGVSPATASRVLRIFWEAGWIEKNGNGTTTKYALIEGLGLGKKRS